VVPNPPRYVSDQERAENRARYINTAFWALIALPLLAAVMLYGYSDQAPAWLRSLTLTLDSATGYPVLALLRWLTGGA